MKIVFSLVLLFLAGCVSTIIYSSKGEELYSNKCSGCHRLHSKTEFTSEKWKSEIEEMGKKAKLSDDEKRMLIEYLTKDGLQAAKP
ncbi:hypothetical protein APF79_06900 [bacterium BRH_c32]|jgi:cytochrome c5|nr:MAG: hypothetical protein APF79_06900 [bacterium BRH_c32]